MRLNSVPDSPGVTKIDLGNIEMFASMGNARQAILYFHGFPGPYEELPPGETRFVDHFFAQLGGAFDFYYPIYTITKDGVFSFLRSLADARLALDYVLGQHRYDSILLIGQSWGAVVGLSLTSSFAFRRVILVTPYLKVPQGDAGAITVRHYCQLHPGLLLPKHLPSLISEFETISLSHSPQRYLDALACPIDIFAASQDEIVPIDVVKGIVQNSKNIKLHVLDGQTHKIERREELGSLILNEIK